MRLSYTFDIDTPNKRRIFNRMVSENGIQEQNGVLFVDVRWESLYPALLQFAQLVAKVANMQLFKREVIQSMFYQLLEEFIAFSSGKPRSERANLTRADLSASRVT